MHIEILKKRKYWYWRIIADNGQVLATSETYSSHAMALKTAMKVMEYKSFVVLDSYVKLPKNWGKIRG